MQDCTNCGKQTGHKRALGWGTFFAVILTGGLWLFAIPFYPSRCIVCGNSEKQTNVAIKVIFVIIGIFVVIVAAFMSFIGPVAAPFLYTFF